MQIWPIVAVILLAVLVGVAIPVLLELRATLRSARRLLDSAGPRLDRVLDEVSQVTGRINHVGVVLEENALRARSLLDTIGEIAAAFQKIRSSLQTAATIGCAVGPAVAAAFRAAFRRDADDVVERKEEQGSERIPEVKEDRRPVGSEDA